MQHSELRQNWRMAACYLLFTSLVSTLVFVGFLLVFRLDSSYFDIRLDKAEQLTGENPPFSAHPRFFIAVVVFYFLPYLVSAGAAYIMADVLLPSEPAGYRWLRYHIHIIANACAALGVLLNGVFIFGLLYPEDGAFFNGLLRLDYFWYNLYIFLIGCILILNGVGTGYARTTHPAIAWMLVVAGSVSAMLSILGTDPNTRIVELNLLLILPVGAITLLGAYLWVMSSPSRQPDF